MKKRVVLFVLVVSAVLWGAGAYAATATTFYRGYCIGSDGRVIGLGAVDESEIGKSVAFRFVAEDGTVRQVERLAGDKMVSTRLTLEDGRIVRDEAYSKGQLASVRTYTYDADGRVASESYAQHAKGESQHKYTKTYRYDEAGRVAEIRNEQATGSVQVEVYDGGVLVERRMIDRQGRLSRRYRYVYGARFKRIWEKEQIFDDKGACVRENSNRQIEGVEAPGRPAVEPVRTVGDEAALNRLKVTHPAFSPTNSPHVKDKTRLSVELNHGRPLRLELRDTGGKVVRTFWKPRVSSRHYAHFTWMGALDTGAMAPDGVYAYCVRTPVVCEWRVAFAARGPVGQRLLDCTGTFAYVCDPASARVVVFDQAGEVERVVELAVDQTWAPRRTWPSSLDVVRDERLYMRYGAGVRVYDMEGALIDEIVPEFQGLPWASSFGVGEDGTVYCVVEHTHTHGKDKCGGFTVLALDEQGRATRVVTAVSGLTSERDGPPFVHEDVLYVNAYHFARGGIQRVLLVIDPATGKRRMVECRSVVTEAGLRRPTLVASGGVDFHTPGGMLAMGFDCGWRTIALQGSRVYALTDLGSVLRCYETASDKVLLEGELVVDNTAPTGGITYPGPEGLVAGEPDQVAITGTATDVNFEKYEVFWRPATMRHAKWRLLTVSETPCEDGTLAVWDTTTIGLRNAKNRDIELKLVVTDKAGNTTDEPFMVCYDADDDGFSNEFEASNSQLDKNARTERRTATIVPHLTLMLRREFPINGTCPLAVQLVDEGTGEVLDRGLLECEVNVGSVRPRVRVHSTTAVATTNWQTPSSVAPAGVLTVELPPQGIHNVWYTAEAFEISLPLVVDSDFDGLTDEYEQTTNYGFGSMTSATNADTDGDGIDDLYDLAPTDAPSAAFSEDYPVGALRFKQTYHVISIAGDGSKVTKNGINVGRWPLMDKSISDESVQGYFNDEVFKIASEDPLERSPLHVIAAERKETYEGEKASERTYTAPTGIPKYVFTYYTKEFLYELSVANREVTKYPTGSVFKYGFVSKDVSLYTGGGNTVVVQFTLGGANRWRDEDETGNFTKMFMRYALYRRGQVATTFPYFTGLAPMEWVGKKRFQCHLALPDEVCEKMASESIPGEQTIVLSPVWVEHKGGPLPCMYKNHPPIPPERDSCLYCSYRPQRDTFIPVYTRGSRLTALGMRYNHYATTAIGRLTARAGGPAIEATTDYERLTGLFEHFHPRRGSVGLVPNGLVPVTLDGTVYQVLYVRVPSANWRQVLETQMPNADAVVLRARSSWGLNELVERLKQVIGEHDWAAEWALVDPGETASDEVETAEASGADEDAAEATVEPQADDALDKLETVGTRFKEIREVAEFAVDLSNMPASFKADQLTADLTDPTIFGSMMSSTTKTSHNVAVTKLPNGKLEVALQRRAMFSAKRSGNRFVSTRYYTKTVRTEQVDDLADSKIATEYGVVHKIPTQLIVGAKIGATLMTDGVELYKAIQNRDGVDIVYYGVRGTSNVLAALGSASVKWKNTRLFKGIQLTKTAKFNTVAAVVAAIDVGYNVFKTATADTWLGRAAYAEKTAAAVVDGVIGCIEPYGAAATIGWQVGAFAGEKICEKFGWGESTELSRSVTSSIGSAVVFLFEEASLLGVPTAHANDAGTRVQNKLAQEVADHNTYLDERNLEDPREVFIPPDED